MSYSQPKYHIVWLLIGLVILNIIQGSSQEEIYPLLILASIFGTRADILKTLNTYNTKED